MADGGGKYKNSLFFMKKCIDKQEKEWYLKCEIIY